MKHLSVPMVKLCGLSTIDAVQAARDGHATHIGFIFFPKSPRYVTPSDAARLAREKGSAASVAVSVDADDKFLDEIVETVSPDLLQLHGQETVQRVKELKKRYSRPIIKAFSIKDPEDLVHARTYQDTADLLLLDAKPPENSDLPGGNGVSFDWKLIEAFQSHAPVMLSGGIDQTNVETALQLVTRRDNNLQGLDVSSGVESAPGVKDIHKITSFMAQCQND